MNRYARYALAFAAPALALSACAGAVTVASVANDVALISNSFVMTVMPELLKLGLPLPEMNQASTAISDLQSASAALSVAESTSDALPLVQRVSTDVLAVAQALSGQPGLPTAVQAVIGAAQVLVPVIEQDVGIATAGAAPAMSVAQARAVLAAAGHP